MQTLDQQQKKAQRWTWAEQQKDAEMQDQALHLRHNVQLGLPQMGIHTSKGMYSRASHYGGRGCTAWGKHSRVDVHAETSLRWSWLLTWLVFVSVGTSP